MFNYLFILNSKFHSSFYSQSLLQHSIFTGSPGTNTCTVRADAERAGDALTSPR